MQSAVNDSFWDAHGVEIGAGANFDPKTLFWGTGNNYGDWMLADAQGVEIEHVQILDILTPRQKMTGSTLWDYGTLGAGTIRDPEPRATCSGTPGHGVPGPIPRDAEAWNAEIVRLQFETKCQLRSHRGRWLLS